MEMAECIIQIQYIHIVKIEDIIYSLYEYRRLQSIICMLHLYSKYRGYYILLTVLTVLIYHSRYITAELKPFQHQGLGTVTAELKPFWHQGLGTVTAELKPFWHQGLGTEIFDAAKRGPLLINSTKMFLLVKVDAPARVQGLGLRAQGD